jgi:hypothetical protein
MTAPSESEPLLDSSASEVSLTAAGLCALLDVPTSVIVSASDAKIKVQKSVFHVHKYIHLHLYVCTGCIQHIIHNYVDVNKFYVEKLSGELF